MSPRLSCFGQTPSTAPVNIVVASEPHPFVADEKVRLFYELFLTNFSSRDVELTRIEVMSGRGHQALARYEGDGIQKMLSIAGSDTPQLDTRKIPGGGTAILFLDLGLAQGVRPPAELAHQISLQLMGKNGQEREAVINAPIVTVSRSITPVIKAPVRGGNWVAFNGLSSADHRRTELALDGKVRIAQRFAIDWMCLGPDGRLFHGTGTENSSYYSYGTEILAVADGHVASVQDGLPDNHGNNVNRVVPIKLDTIAGNYIILDLGQGQYALYAHLRPGSLRVKVGDRVRAGQVLAQLGNSGNSDAPHLHFQLMDANSVLGAQGLSYEIGSFTQLGIVSNPDLLDSGESWHPQADNQPIMRKREFPLDNAVVRFE